LPELTIMVLSSKNSCCYRQCWQSEKFITIDSMASYCRKSRTRYLYARSWKSSTGSMLGLEERAFSTHQKMEIAFWTCKKCFQLFGHGTQIQTKGKLWWVPTKRSLHTFIMVLG
jgi:hypothetical protein